MPEPLDLPGCTSESLMGYLKALGAFRLVVEQADPGGKLSWHGGHARLHTVLDRDGLTDFFLNRYRPTPIVGPWGARSGFYPDASESSARKAIEAISTSSDPRLERFRSTIDTVRAILARLNIREKADLDLGDNYILLLRSLRNDLPDDVGDWLDAVYCITDDRKFPPLLGTGGNEGSGSYMSNFCQTVKGLLIDRSADPAIETTLYATPGTVREHMTVGHFDPGAIGGPNSAVGFDGGGGVNPWDFLLAIEGTLLFRSAVARRLGSDTIGKAAFPFTVDPNPVGYGSAAGAEDVRAEVWMPEWPAPIRLHELEYLLTEGRAQIGRRQARTTVEFARAAVTLGSNRGVAGFHRYLLAKRNGLSYFAVYAGRFPVRQVPNARLLDQLDRWLGPFRRMAGDKNAPPRFAAAVRRIDAAIYDVCRYGGTPFYMQGVLRAAGRAERELANGEKMRAEFPGLRPLSELSADWLSACDDKSPEYRLAASLAFMSDGENRRRSMRTYLEPVAWQTTEWRFDEQAKGVVWSNTDLPGNLTAILARRLQDGADSLQGWRDEEKERASHPLWTDVRFRPRLADVLQYLDNGTDDTKLTDLLWALPAVDVYNSDHPFKSRRTVAPCHLMVDFSNLKLTLLPEPVTRPGASDDAGLIVPNEPRVIALLHAGRLNEAVEVACRRLQASGLPPYLTAPIAGRMKPVRDLVSTPDRTRRLTSALLFPLRPNAIRRLTELTIREAKPEP